MANILIAGDSWGIGVFAGQGPDYGATDQGIQSILEDQQHTVTNISKAGGSNYLMIDRLNGHWGDTGRCLFGVDPSAKIPIDFSKLDHILFLQTDIFRERHYYGKQHSTDTDTQWKLLEQEFVSGLLKFESLTQMIDDYFTRLYTDLNTIGLTHNKKIIMIGGWSQLHPSVYNYPNLIPAVPSATKLLIPELQADCYLSDPEWFTQLDQDAEFLSKFNTEFKQIAVTNANKLALIYKNWNEVHPDIQGYKKIVDQLLPYFG